MRKLALAGAVVVALVALFAIVRGNRSPERSVEPRSAKSTTESASPQTPPPSPNASAVAVTPAPSPNPSASPVSSSASAPEALQGFLYGRITTVDGATFEGRLRWGDGAEAFWGDYFNGWEVENPWVALVPPEKLPKESHSFGVFGLKIFRHERSKDLARPFLARFGDLARIEAERADVRVTMKSGTVVVVHRFEASDFDDGVRVWDAERGEVELDTGRIRAIELLPTAAVDDASARLHGTVRTKRGAFTGFLQWDREECVGSDQLQGDTADGELAVRFDTIRAIARRSADRSLVTLLDGREIELSGTSDVGEGHLGVYVDDARYGRVLVSWEAFERVDFDDPASDPGGATGPGYDDFPPGRPLAGVVVTKDGRNLSGRIVYDLDESESTETLDAPLEGVDYTIPFALVSSIVPCRPERGEAVAIVTLRSGETLQLEPEGDLGEGNAGLLIFAEGQQQPEYVQWSDVERIDLDTTGPAGKS